MTKQPVKRIKRAPKEMALFRRKSGDEYLYSYVRVMARAEGYAMVRYKGCAPFIADERDLST